MRFLFVNTTEFLRNDMVPIEEQIRNGLLIKNNGYECGGVTCYRCPLKKYNEIGGRCANGCGCGDGTCSEESMAFKRRVELIDTFLKLYDKETERKLLLKNLTECKNILREQENSISYFMNSFHESIHRENVYLKDDNKRLKENIEKLEKQIEKINKDFIEANHQKESVMKKNLELCDMLTEIKAKINSANIDKPIKNQYVLSLKIDSGNSLIVYYIDENHTERKLGCICNDGKCKMINDEQTRENYNMLKKYYKNEIIEYSKEKVIWRNNSYGFEYRHGDVYLLSFKNPCGNIMNITQNRFNWGCLDKNIIRDVEGCAVNFH